MATYMISWETPAENRNEVFARFTEGSAMEEPSGVTDLGRWHSAEGRRGWGVVETDDPKRITDWLLRWTDITSFEVRPVISDEELGDLISNHGFG